MVKIIHQAEQAAPQVVAVNATQILPDTEEVAAAVVAASVQEGEVAAVTVTLNTH